MEEKIMKNFRWFLDILLQRCNKNLKLLRTMSEKVKEREKFS